MAELPTSAIIFVSVQNLLSITALRPEREYITIFHISHIYISLNLYVCSGRQPQYVCCLSLFKNEKSINYNQSHDTENIEARRFSQAYFTDRASTRGR